MDARVRWIAPLALAAAIAAWLTLPAQSDDAPLVENVQEVAEFDEADLRFFEQRIRPVLAANCYECHSERSGDLKGGLYLDTRSAMHRGGESGQPAVVPGNPEDSLLIEALLYHGDVKMPPDSKLHDPTIDDFIEWVERGAPDPREGDRPEPETLGGGIDPDDLWSLSPLHAPEPPDIEPMRTLPAPPAAEPNDEDNLATPANDIDRFILAALDEAGLSPAPLADRRTLIRRAYFDLIGLPPSPQQVEAFVNDDSPDAFERVIDELLSSPRFGERWGRHWLDVARFAESSGGSRSRIYPQAWRYRDYVIRSFNDDVPYDQFVVEQLAGDLMPYDTPEQRRRQLIATGFLSLGPKNLDAQDKAQQRMDVVDEQLDAVGQAFMGMTMGCARCHDHMFDPVSIDDYYAMAGFFRSTQTLVPGNINSMMHRELPMDPQVEQRRAELEQREAELNEQLEQAQAAERELRDELGIQPPEGPYAIDSLPGIVVDAVDAHTDGAWASSTHYPTYVNEHYLHDDNAGKGDKSVTYIPDLPRSGRYEVRISYNHADSRASNVPVTIQHAEGRSVVHVDQRQPPPLDPIFVSLGEFAFEEGQDGSVTIGNEGTSGFVIADAVQFIHADELAELRERDADEAAREELTQSIERIRELEAVLAEVRSQMPPREQAMAVRDYDNELLGDAPLHIRGEVRRLGDPVPRGFLSAVDLDADVTIPEDASGRVELAEWLTHPDHPLTARVMANRIWGYLIGAPIVGTPDNFGMRGEQPTHPELLDHLATAFVENDYSIKAMIRQVMLSRTYRQAHVHDSQQVQADPDNHLRWRADRRRLDAEAMRDTMLVLSGDLDEQMFGDTLDGRTGDRDDHSPDSNRRSVYLAVFRSALPEFLEVFDLADPNLVYGRRNVSNVPTQALYLLNSPFMFERSASLADRVMAQEGGITEQAEWLYERALGRPATDAELDIAKDLLADIDTDDTAAMHDGWRQLAHALLASLEFRYVD